MLVGTRDRKQWGETLQNSVMCFDKPFDGVYFAFLKIR
nr:MAG TPA: hypothetical protein [Caudoviricetes sp.]